MKIKTKTLSYKEVRALPHARIRDPRIPCPILRALIKFLASSELKKSDFTINVGDMKGVGDKQPALYLMNHSCFTDLMIASHVIKMPYNIIATTDAFVGKEFLMRAIGCIPTQKFQPDIKLVKDISFALTKLKTSVLMYPEAGYSFDGTTTTLPDSLGKMIKMFNYPVVMILSHGAFNTVEFLGIWETLHNPNFNPIEFEGFRKEAGLNAFTLSPTRWIEATNAIGIFSNSGRYGGTYAQTDIAFEFASWISVEFRLYLVMEFQRLKAKEQELLGWSAKRELSKINYRIHTDAIKSHLMAY